MAHSYRVHTICTGAFRETWRMTSATPLDDDAIIEIFGGPVPDDVTLDHLSDEGADEDAENRTITAIEEEQPAAAPRVDADADVNWQNNAIQFPRLIAEIEAVAPLNDAQWAALYGALSASMDLPRERIKELFDRAQTTWDTVKANTSKQNSECEHPSFYWINRKNLNWRCVDGCGFQFFGKTVTEARREAKERNRAKGDKP